MADHIVDIEIEDEDIDLSIRRRTVKVSVEKKDYVYRSDILDLFISVFGNAQVVEGIAKRDKSEEWFVTVKSDTVYELCVKKEVRIFKGRKFYFSDASKCVLNLRVHWVPRDFKNSYVAKVFSRWGDVKSVQEETSNVNGCFVMNGLRQVTICCNEAQTGNIPHMIRASKGRVRMLVTAPGRLPLCLRCNCIGHVSASCGQGRQDFTSKPLFTEIVGGRRSPSQAVDCNVIEEEKNEEGNNSDDSSDEDTDSEKGALVIDEDGMDERSDIEEKMESVVGETGSGESSSGMGKTGGNVRETGSDDMEETEGGSREVIETDATVRNKRRNESDVGQDKKKTKSGGKGGKAGGKKK
ncbi:hypothetical protein SNE40_003416 [Patella caerulea]|uniref:Gag-like protein n=1 Tax=Patella caerulea TaxID=87958 RepID=A0AAN8Q0U7_PATCE